MLDHELGDEEYGHGRGDSRAHVGADPTSQARQSATGIASSA